RRRPPHPTSGAVSPDSDTQTGMVRLVAISVLLVGVAITALLFRQRVLPPEAGVQPLPAAPLEHSSGPSVVATSRPVAKHGPVATKHRPRGRVQIALASPGT